MTTQGGTGVFTTSFSSGADLRLTISGATVDTQYHQFRAAGAVNLTGVDLALAGSYVPVSGNVFTIVSATSLTGTFNGLANNSVLTFNGRSLRLNYTASAVTLTDAGLPPVTVDDTGQVGQGATATLNVLANDSDPDGPASGLIAELDPTGLTDIGAGRYRTSHGGVVQLASNGSLTYTSLPGYVGDDAFGYFAVDPVGGKTHGLITITVTNAVPVAVDDAAQIGAGSSAALNVLGNDTDADGPLGGVLTATLDVAGLIDRGADGYFTVNGGSVSLNGNGALLYMPAAGFVGDDVFGYFASDLAGASDRGSVTITVTNLPPTAGNDAATIGQRQSTSLNVLANDSDPDAPAGCSLQAELDPADVTSNGSGGLVTSHGGLVQLTSAGQLTYTAAAGFQGDDAFGYFAVDFAGNRTRGVVTITVLNTSPVTGNDVGPVGQGASTSLNVLANDSDPDGPPGVSMTAQLNGAGLTSLGGGQYRTVQGGVISLASNGLLSYAAPIGFKGDDSIGYFAVDDAGSQTAGTVTITVTNLPPVVVHDSGTAGQGATVQFSVLANDSDPDGLPGGLTAELDTTGLTSLGGGKFRTGHGGTVELASGGGFTYSAGYGFSGDDAVGYFAVDPLDDRTHGTITVTLTNTPPVAVNDAGSVVEGNTVSLNVLANDADADGPAGGGLQSDLDTAGLTSLGGGHYRTLAGGVVRLTSGGILTYTAALGFVGGDQVGYFAVDVSGDRTPAIVRLTVTPANRSQRDGRRQ